jgi:alpha-soluble NSF attachment protein
MDKKESVADYQTNAEGYVKKAESYLKSDIWALRFRNDYSQAAKNYNKAAELYEKAKVRHKAFMYFRKAGQYYISIKDLHNADVNYRKAVEIIVSSNHEGALLLLSHLYDLYAKDGKILNLADITFEIAKIYDEHVRDGKTAITWYLKAYEFYSGSVAKKSSAKMCLYQAAMLYGITGEYRRSAELFEKVAVMEDDIIDDLEDCTTSKFNAYNIHTFRSTIAALAAGDVIFARRLLSKFAGYDIAFRHSREYMFLCDICECIEQGNVTKFTQIVRDYDTTYNLGEWNKSILLQVKETISLRDH